MKRFIPPKVHGTMDVVTSGLWLAGPEVFRIKWSGGSALGPKLFGALVLVNASVTDWGEAEGLEYGGARLWSVKTHAIIETIGAAAVAVAPWVTGSRRGGWNYWVPHLGAFGIELVFALGTKNPPDAKR